MDVELAADGAGVGELACDVVERRYEPRLGGLRAARRLLAKAREGVEAAHPGAEVLGGELAPRRLAQVFVDVGRVDGPRRAVLAQVLEELVARDLLALADAAGHAASASVIRLALPPLARKRKKIRPPRTRTWRLRSVVRPTVPLAVRTPRCRRGCRSSPASRTTMASTFSRGMPRRRRSRRTRWRRPGSARPNSTHAVELGGVADLAPRAW